MRPKGCGSSEEAPGGIRVSAVAGLAGGRAWDPAALPAPARFPPPRPSPTLVQRTSCASTSGWQLSGPSRAVSACRSIRLHGRGCLHDAGICGIERTGASWQASRCVSVGFSPHCTGQVEDRAASPCAPAPLSHCRDGHAVGAVNRIRHWKLAVSTGWRFFDLAQFGARGDKNLGCRKSLCWTLASDTFGASEALQTP